MAEQIPRGRTRPLWWTRPVRPLTYHAVHRVFERVNAQVGTSAALHSLRHTAAYRMAEDPVLPLTDVQFVLGHAALTTTHPPHIAQIIAGHRWSPPEPSTTHSWCRPRPNCGLLVWPPTTATGR